MRAAARSAACLRTVEAARAAWCAGAIALQRAGVQAVAGLQVVCDRADDDSVAHHLVALSQRLPRDRDAARQRLPDGYFFDAEPQAAAGGDRRADDQASVLG